MNLLVALLADDEGLATTRGHSLNPEQFLVFPWPIQICELPDEVLCLTQFALIGWSIDRLERY
jgi:hypothetical protein